MADVSRPATLAALLLSLTACGSGSSDQFAPECPRPAILADAGTLHRYRGSGRDFLDVVLEGQIDRIQGSCTADGPRAVAVTVSVEIELTRGPAATGRAAVVPFFVAVTEGDRVLDKQVYVARAVFPENTDRVRLTGDNVDLSLPVSPTKKASAYQVTVGFQLTPAELETNRRLSARR